jgi:hypothetical protein
VEERQGEVMLVRQRKWKSGRARPHLVLEGIFFGLSFRKILINYVVPGGGVRT